MRHIDGWFDLTSVAEGRRIVVLGLPWDGAASGRPGAADAPAAIREWAATQQAIDERGRKIEGVRVEDRGDVAGGHAEFERAAEEVLHSDDDAFLLALGGDHSVTQPLLAAAVRRWPDLGLLCLDAHPDLFSDYDGDRASHACTVARAWDAGLDPAATALVGLRSFAAQERAGLDRAGLVVTAAEWSAGGTAALVARVAETLAGRPVFVSLDIDVLDPSAAPGTGYPIAGGPSSRQLLDLLAEAWTRIQVVAFDLVEVSPPLDPGGVTAAAAAHLLLQVMGHVARSGERDALQ